jgi:phosphonate transport system substrate-binding protein
MEQRSSLLLLLLLLLFSGCESETDISVPNTKKPKLSRLERPLKIVISPVRSQMKQVFQPLGKALSDRLKVELVVEVAKSYQATIDALVGDKADLYFLPALSYLRAEAKTGRLRIIVSEETRASLYDRAVLVVRSNSPVRSVEELKGKRFALVTPHSASGYLFPRVCLKRHGLDPNEILSESKINFAQNHDRVLKLLFDNKVDVAATYDWAVTAPNGRLRTGLRVVAWSEPLPHSLMICSPRLSDDEAELIRHSFLSLSREKAENGNANRAMELIGITGFSVLPDSALESLRTMDKEDAQ